MHNVSGGNWSYISLFLSPSKPPKDNDGFDGVKNHHEPERRQYQSQAGINGIYFTRYG
ncbi:MAG: hypothetical protein WKF59_16925 [Chitinophagaceae bacterium]